MIRQLVLLVGLTCSIASCGTSPATRLFLPQPAPGVAPAADSPEIVLGLRSVELPKYLDNDYMPVFASSSSELERDEFERWASPFGDLFGGLLVRSLHREGIAQVILDPWPDFFKPRCSVWVRVTEWVVVRDHIEARISWAVSGLKPGEPELRSFQVSESKSGSSPDAIGAATATIVARLSSEVATVVKSSNRCQAQYIDKK